MPVAGVVRRRSFPRGSLRCGCGGPILPRRHRPPPEAPRPDIRSPAERSAGAERMSVGPGSIGSMPFLTPLPSESLEFDADFSGPDLDPKQWLPVYLPQWSSRERTRARYDIGDGVLRLRVDADQPAWSPEFDGVTRVSNLQTAVRSGAVGSMSGQHPFRDGLVVREAQPDVRLYTPRFGRIEVVAAVDGIDEHAMAALWLIGVEDEPEQSAEICVFEIFGRDIRDDGSALVGLGVHPFRDPAIVDDFERVPFAGDVREPHRYAVEWRADGIVFAIDDEVVKRVVQSPQYPMQLMLDVFAFPPEQPERAAYPESFAVHAVRGWRLD
ncbi:glycoside hydrolase family 16 [Agromyces badenianii]|uniref:Glycoside hydrolase family 16 n=2 Tax=Agromyces badenianii TaxID=2080742 RepID=A0A2S0WTJ0_9MICO|nr:glycoside hydrolase family 16 [Agromyces badenianii]